MRLLHVFYAVLVTMLWGGNFVAAKTGMMEAPPFLLTALRFMATALLLVPFVPKPDAALLRAIFTLSLTLGCLHFSMMFAALHYGLEIASCAVVVQMGVPFSCLLGVWLFGERIGWRQILGLVASFAGVFVIAGNPNVLAHPLGFALALLGAFFWGVTNIQLKQLGQVNIFQFLGWMALGAVPMLLALSYAVEGNPLQYAPHFSWRMAAALIYTVLFSTIAGYGMWYYLISKYPVSQVAPYSLLAPLFGIAMGEMVYRAGISWQEWVGGALTIIGVTVIVFRRAKLAEHADTI